MLVYYFGLVLEGDLLLDDCWGFDFDLIGLRCCGFFGDWFFVGDYFVGDYVIFTGVRSFFLPN